MARGIGNGTGEVVGFDGPRVIVLMSTVLLYLVTRYVGATGALVRRT